MAKLSGVNDYITRSATHLEVLATEIMAAIGCSDDIASMVAHHLVDASCKGVDSHGVMRLIGYAEQAESGYFLPSARPSAHQNQHGAWIIDGGGGMGIPAMAMGIDKGTNLAKEHGMAVVGVTHCAHTGRLGAFCEQGAAAACLTITFGGGARRNWRQVVPYGGAKAKLPTNPYGFGIPGGDRGPVILDFATSAGAGGWIYLAKSAGGQLPDGLIVDAQGNSSTDPDDYLNGGALLPAAGAKGYGLALMAELVGEALLGAATTELNWIILLVDTTRYRDDSTFKRAAESVLSDIRECPAADGFDRVEIPGERERALEKIRRKEGVPIPAATWDQIVTLADQFNVRSVR